MVICSKVSKNNKKYICICDNTKKVVSFDRVQIDALVSLYAFEHNVNYNKTMSELYNGELVLNISINKEV